MAPTSSHTDSRAGFHNTLRVGKGHGWVWDTRTIQERIRLLCVITEHKKATIECIAIVLLFTIVSILLPSSISITTT